jgi:Uma2 family endonuclease
MATTINRLITFAEFEQLPEAPDGRYELRHGELVKVPFPKYGHHRIQQQLRRLLEAAAREAGEVSTEFGFRALTEYEYRRADVAYVSRERSEQTPDDAWFQGAPDLTIEILSPSNAMAEMLDKERLCLENGAKEFWIVDPVHKQVKVSTSDGRNAVWKSGHQIPLFFGGSIPVDAIFRDEP